MQFPKKPYTAQRRKRAAARSKPPVTPDDKTEVIDAIGDIQVTLILQCKLWGIDYDKCLEEAYKVIKNRTGKMVNGTFVKDKTCDDCIELEGRSCKIGVNHCLNK